MEPPAKAALNVLARARAALTNRHCPRDDCTRLLVFAPILQIFIVDRRATKPSHSKGLITKTRLRGVPAVSVSAATS